VFVSVLNHEMREISLSFSPLCMPLWSCEGGFCQESLQQRSGQAHLAFILISPLKAVAMRERIHPAEVMRKRGKQARDQASDVRVSSSGQELSGTDRTAMLMQQ
jgi:hypothetical protein